MGDRVGAVDPEDDRQGAVAGCPQRAIGRGVDMAGVGRGVLGALRACPKVATSAATISKPRTEKLTLAMASTRGRLIQDETNGMRDPLLDLASFAFTMSLT
jgi:hypothetical protein